MKTQISIEVQNENWLSRCMSIYMSFGLFVKAKVNMYVDDTSQEPIVLKARKEPYIIEVEPGNHSIVFTAKNKANMDKFMGGVIAGAVGMGMGTNALGTMLFAEEGADFVSGVMGHNRVQDNLLECSLQEGDLLKIRIKPKRNGTVKIKIL